MDAEMKEYLDRMLAEMLSAMEAGFSRLERRVERAAQGPGSITEPLDVIPGARESTDQGLREAPAGRIIPLGREEEAEIRRVFDAASDSLSEKDRAEIGAEREAWLSAYGSGQGARGRRVRPGQGLRFELTLERGRLVITPLAGSFFSLEQLLAGITPENLHGETETDPGVGG